MGRYQAYPEYKDSGVEWLDVIPSHWTPASLKMLVDVRDGTHDTPEYVETSINTYPLVTSKDVTSGKLQFDLCKHISEQDYLQIIKRSMVNVGDVLMPMIGTVGFPVVVKNDCQFAIKNLALFKTANSKKIDTSFLNYFLQSQECDIQFSLESRGGVQNFVSLGTLRDLGFSNPPILEQRKIANFLDHETAKIDTLIEKQQQLIQLLKEKRQAVISHAVTKGLNPNAPMKDSGVEWLGEVPEHWDVCALKYVTNGVFTGGTPRNESSFSDSETDLNWFGPSDFRESRKLSESNKYLTLESHKLGDSKMFSRDSVLVIGIGATLGKVGYCNKDFSCNQQINVIYPNKRVSYKYLAIALSMQEAQMKLSSNASTIGIMNQEKTKSILIAVPPSEEQEQIVLNVESTDSKYAKLIELAGNQVELLLERRTALISAAVTGKIDVRNFSAQLT